jgi:hypothetical protein
VADEGAIATDATSNAIVAATAKYVDTGPRGTTCHKVVTHSLCRGNISIFLVIPQFFIGGLGNRS